MTLPGKTLPDKPVEPVTPPEAALAGVGSAVTGGPPKTFAKQGTPGSLLSGLARPTKAAASPLRQELAIAHAAWRQRSTDQYDASRSMAWATMMEPLLIDNPELRNAFLRDFTVAINAVEADRILDRLPFLDVSLTDRMMQASDEQIRELSAHLRSTEDLATQAREYGEIRRRLESTASGAAAGTMAPGSGSGRLPFRLDQVTLSEAARVGESANLDRMAQLMLAAEGGLDPQAVGVVGEFLERASGRTLTWFQTEGRLVADIDGHLYDLRLDGEVENTPLEVLGAIVDSFYEQRHELLRADPLPGPQTFFGAAFEFIGAVTAPIFQAKDAVDAPLNWLLSDHTTEGFRTSETIVAQRLQTAIETATVTRVNPDDILIAGIALQGGPDQSFLSVSQSFAAEYAAMPPELQEQLQEQLSAAPTREQVQADLEGLVDTRHSVRRVMDQAVAGVMDVFVGWEAFVQNNVVQTFNFLGDLGQGIVAAPGGFQKFKDAFEAVPPEVDNLAEYWGITPGNSLYGTVNLFGSLAGDPFTYIGATGPMRAAQMSRLLGENAARGGVEELLAKRWMRPWLDQITTFAGRGPESNPAAILGLLEFTGISNRGMSEIINGLVDPIVVLRREMTEGLMVPTLTGGLRFRNSAQWVARMAQTGDSKIGRYLRTIRAQLSTGRTISLSPTRYRSSMTESLIARSVTGGWSKDPQLFRKWADELLALSDPEESVAKSWYALRAEQASGRLVQHDAAGRAAGYTRFQAAKAKIVAHEDRLAALDEMISAAHAEGDSALAGQVPSAAPGLPPLFHGSRGGATEVIEGAGRSASNLYGPGIYSTTDLGVAGSYGKGNLPRRIEWLGDEAPRILDGDSTAPVSLRTALRDEAALLDIEDSTLSGLDELLTNSATTSQQAITAFGRVVRSAELPMSEADEVVEAAVRDSLARDFDVVKYAGGQAGGRSGHDIYVWLEESKVSFAEVRPSPLDRFARAAETRYLRDKSPISKAKWDDTIEALRATDPAAFLEARAGLLRNSDDTYRELSTQIEQLRVAREQAIRMGGGGKEQLETRINALVAQRRALTAEVKSLGPRVPRAFLPSDPGYAAFRKGYDEWLTQKQLLNQTWAELKTSVARLQIPGSRLAQEDFARRFWQDWGQEVFGMPGVAFKDLPWEKLTGRKLTGSQVPVAFGEQLAGLTSLDAAAAQRLLGPSVRGIFQAPASPMGMVAYSSRANDGWWARFMVPNPDRTAIWSRIIDGTKTAFAMNVLMNPFTWIRSNIDEPLRYVAQRGFKGRPSEAAPGARVASPVMVGARRLQASTPTQIWPTGMRATQDDIMRAHANIGIKPFEDRGEPVIWLARSREAAKTHGAGADYAGRAEFQAAAHNMFNGVLPSQPMWRAYGAARHLDDPQAWRNFWEDGGGRLIGGTVTDLSGGPYTGLTSTQALAGMDEVVGFFAKQTGNPEAFSRAFWRKLATGDDMSDSLLRQLTVIPPAGPHTTGVVDAAFDVMFGRPGSVMGSMTFRDFYDQTYGILLGRHGEKILTAETLAARQGIPVEVAKAMLWNGSEAVEDLVRNQGFFTEKMLHVEASRVAQVHADHLAYSMAASTLGQARLSQMFPFLRAQLDFLGYYKTELTNGAVLGLNPRVAAGLKKVGLRNADRLIDMPLPLNLRLASRIADYAGTLTTLPQLEPGGQPTDIFQRLIDSYTFLPSRYDEGLWVQILPGMAPVPSWLLHGLPVEGDGALPQIRDLVSAIYPTFDYNDTRSTVSLLDPLGSMRSFADFVFPDSRVSLRRIAQRGAAALVTNLAPGSPLSQLFNNAAQPPPGFVNQVRRQLVDDLRDNPVRDINSTPYTRYLAEQINGAWRATTTGNLTRTLADLDPTGLAGSFLIDSDDGEYLDAYRGMVGALGDMHSMGFVGDTQRDTIARLWARYESGDITYDEARDLADTFKAITWGLPDAYQDYLVVTNPELAVNLISTWQVTGDVPDDVAQYVRGDRLNSRIDPELNRELRERGEKEGWLIRRPPEDWYDQAYTRYAQAVRGLRNFVWKEATGISWTTSPAQRDSGVQVTGPAALALQALSGAEVTAGYGRGELNDLLRSLSQPVAGNTGSPSSPPVGLSLEMDTYLKTTGKDAGENGFEATEPWDWPTEVLQNVRDRFGQEIDGQRLAPEDYNRYFAPLYGALDYTPAQPPALDSVPDGVGDNSYRFTVPAPLVEVVDGDTVALEFDASTDLARLTGRGQAQRIRLVGVNAAEVNTAQADYYAQQGVEPPWDQQTRMLTEILNHATTVDFVVFDTERFPTIQQVEGDEVRWLMVLYVDGVPLWDDGVFSFDAPTGAGIGGAGVPLDLYERLTG